MAATRFYLSSTATTPVTPGFAAWTRTSEGTRLKMSPTKDSSALTNKTTFANTSPAANASSLNRQYVSDPMSSGIVFAATDTFSMQLLCSESATNDNVNRAPICIKVYSQDGTTLRATLKALGFYGPNTNAWVVTTNTNKEVANAVALDVGYTTVNGDRLVIEVGAQVSSSGGTTTTATQQFGSASATDLPVDETTTAADNGWFSVTLASGSITFNSSVTATGSSITSSVGSPTATAASNLTATSNPITSSTGSVTVTGNSTAAATGSSITTDVGTSTQSGTANLSTTGVGITSSTGTVVASGNASVDASGQSLAISIGTVTVSTSGGSSTVNATGTPSTISIGSASETGTANVAATGLSISSAVGDVSASAGASVVVVGTSLGAFVPQNINLGVAGSATICSVGSVSPTCTANSAFSGESIASNVGNVSPSISIGLLGTSSTISINTGVVSISIDTGVLVSSTSSIFSIGHLRWGHVLRSTVQHRINRGSTQPTPTSIIKPVVAVPDESESSADGDE